ncbi:cobalt transport protein CbiN [Methanobrevibacter cuticularis]|uniref:Cobalt transport protein CbiN n=1 Tax=Methanobrevibacter cuticularis TaxID=47311 RepID=A0A166DE34_9EURY|nr:PDGLE domain-containing protein [Methanobrevibacter cuticularis]KZX15495.1 cobalt transport protein CbiN [Methanobrevibacter cuticularis]
METRTKQFIIVGLVVAVVIAILAPFLASSNPDGLESTAEKILNPGVSDEAVVQSPMPDYIIPALGEDPISGSIAIVIGVIIVFVGAYALAFFLRKRDSS